MDKEAYSQWDKHFDEKFEQQNPQFVSWFRTHPDYQESIKPRIAHKCQRYMEEYLEAKQYGIIEAEVVVPQLEDRNVQEVS